MRIENAIGMRTKDYIAQLHGDKPKQKPKQSKQENSTMSTTLKDKLDDKQASTTTTTAPGNRKTVTRKINGKQVKLTPTENFIDRSAYRLLMISNQLDQLGKQVGTNYEKTPEMVQAIEDQVLDLLADALKKLKQPASAKARRVDNPFVKVLRNA